MPIAAWPCRSIVEMLMMTSPSLIVPGAEPFFLPAGRTGCLLIHGFTSMPEEMRWLGDDLNRRGFTVLGIRLAGHGTHPQDMVRTRWTDWLVSVEEGLALLNEGTDQVMVLGLSLGGIISLLAAARYPVQGVVSMSAPHQTFSKRDQRILPLARWLRPVYRKRAAHHASLGVRREADYPAYAQFPTRILLEIVKLQAEMQASLPQIKVPVPRIDTPESK